MVVTINNCIYVDHQLRNIRGIEKDNYLRNVHCIEKDNYLRNVHCIDIFEHLIK